MCIIWRSVCHFGVHDTGFIDNLPDWYKIKVSTCKTCDRGFLRSSTFNIKNLLSHLERLSS